MLRLFRIYFLFAAYSKSKIKIKILERLSLPPNLVRFYLTGRNALMAISDELKTRNTSANIALIPRYICDVVPKTLSSAGFEVVSYSVNAGFEPDLQAMRKLIGQLRPKLVLTASMYGSDPYLEGIDDPEFVRLLQESETHWIIDCCQNAEIMQDIDPRQLSQSISLLLSFNSKSFPGLLGGLIYTTMADRLKEERNTLKDILRLHFRLLREAFLTGIRRTSRIRPSFQSSSMRDFPFGAAKRAIDKIQLAAALDGLNLLPRIRIKRGQEAAKIAESVLKNRFWQSSPYLVWTGAGDPPADLGRKAPYADWFDSTKSQHPALKVITNQPLT